MDRSNSQDHIAFGPETPYATDTFACTSLPTEPAPHLSVMNKNTPPGLKRTRSNSTKPSMARSSTQQATRSDSRHHEASRRSISSHTTPNPYETPVFAPRASQMCANEPYFGKRPITPPDSISSSSTPEKSPTQQSVNPFPGTMAARNARTKTSARQCAVGEDRRKKAAHEHQWKSVFKGIFTRSPVDKAQFERIQGRHWADD